MITRDFYQKTKLGKIRRITLALDGNIVKTQWGFIDSDNIQSTQETCSELYHEGHASYKTPEQNAAILFKRWCDQYERLGNKDSQEEAEESNPMSDLILNPLSTEFRPPKAISKKPCLDKEDLVNAEVPNKKIQALIDSGRFIAEKKYNGLRGLLVKSEGWNLYTIAIKKANDQYPWIIDWFKSFADDLVPEDTMIDLEIVANDADTLKEFEIISSMSPNTKPEKSKDILEKWLSSKGNYVGAVAHNLIIWAGCNALEMPYGERFETLQKVLGEAKGNHAAYLERCLSEGSEDRLMSRVDIRIPSYFKDFATATRLMKEGKWEGLVIYDTKGTSQYSMNAQFYRPEGCWKWKPLKSDDFIIIGFKVGEGKNHGRASSFRIGQYDIDGNMIDCGSVYSGITQDAIDNGLERYAGEVIEVFFADRHNGDTKKGLPTIMHPRINFESCFRSDKNPKDCVYEGE